MTSTPATRRPKRVALALAVVLFVGGSTGLRAEGASYAGLPLAEALRDLQSRGLEIFFTSNLVRPGMRVESEPTAVALRDVLDQLLAPHGLTSEVGPGGRLVVVAADAAAGEIRGVVRGRRDGLPLAGVRVLLPATRREATSAADGRFRLPGVAAGSHTVEAHMPGFVVERVDELPVPAGEVVEVVFELLPAPIALDAIIVTPSSVSLLSKEPVPSVNLDRDDILALPHLGDDIFRAFTLMPGVSGEEVSAQFNVRGGRSDETLILLDRVELYEPYHMKDYSSSLSIIAPKALSEVNLITGGFPVQYGDRMSGVLDMSTERTDSRRSHAGLGVLNAELGSSGLFREQRGHALGLVRRGNLDLAQEVLGEREKPRFWDAFGKVEYQADDTHRFGVHVLHSEDRLDFFNIDPDTIEDYDTSYGNSYLWVTHQAFRKDLFIDSVASAGRVERDRRGREDDTEEEGEEEDLGFTIRDQRGFDVASVKQDWNYQPGERQYLKWGWEVRRLEADYNYFNARTLDEPLEDIRFEPRSGTQRFVDELLGEHYSGYLSDRFRLLDPLTVEIGLRYDRQTLTDDNNLSPRFNLVYAAGASNLRLAWGYFHQSQRPYELQVEDGVTDLTSAERTEQRVLGFERSFRTGRRSSSKHSSLFLRVEAYQRKITDPRPRYENVYEPISIYPEIEADRVLIAPESSQSYGVEVFLRGGGARLEWFASYAWSRIEDRLDGRDTPRRIDQPHAFNFDVNYRAGEHWNVNLAWRWHTGWPTTAISGVLEEDDEGELEPVPVFGPLNGERVSDYHRLDLRASREWHKKKGLLGFFVEIQNLYDRQNVAGFDADFEFEVSEDDEVTLLAIEEPWGGLLPSFGITWEF